MSERKLFAAPVNQMTLAEMKDALYVLREEIHDRKRSASLVEQSDKSRQAKRRMFVQRLEEVCTRLSLAEGSLMFPAAEENYL